MNMWAVSSMPVYPAEQGTRPKTAKMPLPFAVPGHPDLGQIASLPPSSSGLLERYTENINDFLGPAIDGPPSPESIRALNKQMKQASVDDKRRSHHTSSSGSSSLRSLASIDRPSWENALEGLSLSRKSSGRSSGRPTTANNISMLSRERPDSVQIFGKTFFNRRGKLKRESSARKGSAASSGDLYGDAVLPPPPPPPPPPSSSAATRDSTIPALFRSRRTVKPEPVVDEAAAARKMQISQPYNFQHVTHTNRDHVPDLPRASSAALASGPRAWGDMHFADFSSDFLPLNEEDESMTAAPIPPPHPNTRVNYPGRPPSVAPKVATGGPRWLLRHTQSQEHLGMAPPRPPRSPIKQHFDSVSCPPVPPPRVSSRLSTCHDAFDPMGSGSLDRPQLADGGFRQPQPMSLSSETSSPPGTSHGYVSGSDMETIPEHSRSRSVSLTDDENWPLPSPNNFSASDAALPNVPEEEEYPGTHTRWSQASIASNPSLRGSQSVPLLRLSSLRQDDASKRRASGASDTLGKLDLFAAQRALKAALMEDNGVEPLPRESWEDDIDYCYEHAAEADCDYAWERPSFDDESLTPVEDQTMTNPSCDVSPAMLTPGQFDVPSLSPVSQVSSSAGLHEAITPTALSLPKPSNFSLPRPDSKNLLQVRRPSDASSFMESHGFTLSPSLLIPNDYHQQMMSHESDLVESREFSSYHNYGESVSSIETSAFNIYHRASASTTSTVDSMHSAAFERHHSTASYATDLTRLTLSTSSLDIDSYLPPKMEALHRFPSAESHSRAESMTTMPTLPESEEVASTPEEGPAAAGPRPRFNSHGSVPNLIKTAMEQHSPNSRRKESIQTRRQRARTTSLSTPPPANQYALFPSVHMSGTRI
ncbi:hypothetical protein B0T22DRAFT_25262 [Podospora appendiculata]|uniref:CRIB domain-containing protein n=1 Tax=Podospora appendiculata TaxID=314037 RepID=A0AAE0XGE4_9PEZI|nr:hypothetical protein B0T22DRAFT_25262 [Podospora appendiculata]